MRFSTKPYSNDYGGKLSICFPRHDYAITFLCRLQVFFLEKLAISCACNVFLPKFSLKCPAFSRKFKEFTKTYSLKFFRCFDACVLQQWAQEPGAIGNGAFCEARKIQQKYKADRYI